MSAWRPRYSTDCPADTFGQPPLPTAAPGDPARSDGTETGGTGPAGRLRMFESIVQRMDGFLYRCRTDAD